MTDHDMENVNVLSYVSECYVVTYDGIPIAAYTWDKAAKEAMYRLGGSAKYYKLTHVKLPAHYMQGC